MKLKFMAALAAAVLLAGLSFPYEAAEAGGRGGGHGGFGGHGSGGMGMRGMGTHGMGMRSFGHSRFGNFSRHHFSQSHIRGLRGNRSSLSSHRFNRYNKLSGIPKSGLGAHNIKGNTFGQNKLHNIHNLKTLTSNQQLKRATFTPQNKFFNNKFGGKWDHDHDWWRDRHGNWYGYRWYGPVFWPYFWGDYFSFAFWPWAYYDPFWGYGPDVILWGAFWPYGEFYYDDAYAYEGAYSGDIYRPYRRRVAKAQPQASAIAETCTGFAPGVSDMPVQKLEGIIGAAEEQRTAFEDLKAAAAKASEILNKSCPTEPALTPVARLDAMENRLRAMEEANAAVKGPFVRLYSLLTDEQKQRLEAASKPASRRRPARENDVNIAKLCSSQAGFTAVPAGQIASAITLTSEQRQELEKLKAASAKASQDLKSSCPASIPDTLDGRLDAASQRLNALIGAVDTVRPAVRDFYASLTDEQKAALSIQPGQNSRG